MNSRVHTCEPVCSTAYIFLNKMGLSPIPLHHRKKKPRPIEKPYIVHQSVGSGVPTQRGLNFHKLTDESKKMLELLLETKIATKTGGGFVYVSSRTRVNS